MSDSAGSCCFVNKMQMMPALWNGTGVDSWLGAFNYSSPIYSRYDYIKYDPPNSTGTLPAKNKNLASTSPIVIANKRGLSMSLALSEKGNVKGELLSLDGRTLAQYDFGTQNAGMHDFLLPLSGNLSHLLGNGAVICKVQCLGKVFVKKVSFL